MSDSLELACPDADAKARINAFEAALRASSTSFDGQELPLQHFYTPELYGRLIFMQAGLELTTKVHLTEHISIVLQGSILVYSEDGTAKHIVGPCMFITQPGTKRALKALTDTYWATVHPVSVSTPEEALAAIAVDTFQEYDHLLENKS